ncbi:hypothetical protein DFH08DRAFT_894407 [Mycena albidolilacea]|uniref:Uncharacterized protein n=1 Tax=Mycena albidolilacea TaxID=1033008 RepID=A0AAD6ZBR2_9AGAR|nr:hypothetical protein DFH08DRAFT_894407 [Mycena albidolilacea]
MWRFRNIRKVNCLLILLSPTPKCRLGADSRGSMTDELKNWNEPPERTRLCARHEAAKASNLPAIPLTSKKQLHFFEDVGYRHQPFQHCPQDAGQWEKGKCGCDRLDTLDYRQQSCIPRYQRLFQ